VIGESDDRVIGEADDLVIGKATLTTETQRKANPLPLMNADKRGSAQVSRYLPDCE
jgi:hypothetical protein